MSEMGRIMEKENTAQSDNRSEQGQMLKSDSSRPQNLKDSRVLKSDSSRPQNLKDSRVLKKEGSQSKMSPEM